MKNLIFVISFLLFSYAMADHQTPTPQISGRSLVTDQTVEVNLVDDRKKAVVLVFMSAKCPCSNSHVEILKKLATENADMRFVAIHSNPEETFADAQKYFKEHALGFEVLQDEHTKLADLFKAYKTPHAFVLNSHGEIVYRGGVSNSANGPSAERVYLREVLQDIKEGKPPRVSETRTLGCVISREGEKNVF